jgi:hypothetical protein
MRTKALQLWMMAVPLRPTLEHSAGEQALSPERNQTFCVEVLGMKRPEAQREYLTVELRNPEALGCPTSLLMRQVLRKVFRQPHAL